MKKKQDYEFTDLRIGGVTTSDFRASAKRMADWTVDSHGYSHAARNQMFVVAAALIDLAELLEKEEADAKNKI